MKEQTADIFTKPLDDSTFLYLRKKLCGWQYLLLSGYLIARESDQQIRRHTIMKASRLNLET